MISHEFNIADYPADFAKFDGIIEALDSAMRDPHKSVPVPDVVTWFVYWSACVMQKRKVCRLNILDDTHSFYDFLAYAGFTEKDATVVLYSLERQYCRSIADIEIVSDWKKNAIRARGLEYFKLYLRLVETNDIYRSYAHDDNYLDVVEHLKSQPSVFA